VPARPHLLAPVALAGLATLALAAPPQSPQPGPTPAATSSPYPTPKSWEVPDEVKSAKNPIARSPDNEKKGAALFKRFCVPCHGPQGKGDGPVAHYWTQLPKDLADPARQDRLTDGEIFWKLSRGHRQGADVIMPSFSDRIPSADDRWRLVLFVRTLRAGSSPSPSPRH
jgi:mono/diheme cytochrome c family protein